MRKFQQFFNKITVLRSVLRGSIAKQAKEYIGDSINNNRTLTVNQTIRFLESTGQTALANELKQVSAVLKPIITRSRNRTDAVDISEFVSVYRETVMNNKKLRRNIANALRK